MHSLDLFHRGWPLKTSDGHAVSQLPAEISKILYLVIALHQGTPALQETVWFNALFLIFWNFFYCMFYFFIWDNFFHPGLVFCIYASTFCKRLCSYNRIFSPIFWFFLLYSCSTLTNKIYGIVKQVARMQSGIWNLSHAAPCLKRLIYYLLEKPYG